MLPAGARMALGSIPAVDLVVAYGVHTRAGDVLVAAVTLRPGAELTAGELDRVGGPVAAAAPPGLRPGGRSIPVTTWHRPMWRPLQKAGIPRPSRNRQVFRLGEGGLHYERL